MQRENIQNLGINLDNRGKRFKKNCFGQNQAHQKRDRSISPILSSNEGLSVQQTDRW
jgi:hypothetical protein